MEIIALYYCKFIWFYLMKSILRYSLITVLLVSISTAFGIALSPSFRTSMINLWFDLGMYASYSEEDIHKYSQWSYLSQEEFAEIVRDGVSKLNKPLTSDSRIFELGVGVGAALKVIEEDYPNIDFGGSDFSENAINFAKEIFPDAANKFFVHDMTLRHEEIPDNTFDCVLSFGALAMYLTESQMIDAITEALRITKSGGSILLTHFIEPGAQPRRSIVTPVEKSYWMTALPKLGGKDISIYPMLHQGDRYQVSFSKR